MGKSGRLEGEPFAEEDLFCAMAPADRRLVTELMAELSDARLSQEIRRVICDEYLDRLSPDGFRKLCHLLEEARGAHEGWLN